MQITTTPSLNALREMATLNRKWHFWPVQILGNVRAALYLVVGIFVGGRFIYDGVESSPMNMQSIEKGFLVLTVLAAILALLYFRRASKINKTLAAQVPTTINLESSGISLADANGVSIFEPWSLYATFRMGKSIAILNRADKKGFRAIPMDTLSQNEAGQLRSILLSHLPEKN